MSPQFLVTDIDRSIAFYTEKLGFDIDFSYEDFYSGISKDGFSIHLIKRQSYHGGETK
ncbi:MAG: VOC family protein [Sphingobacterium sp.]